MAPNLEPNIMHFPTLRMILRDLDTSEQQWPRVARAAGAGNLLRNIGAEPEKFSYMRSRNNLNVFGQCMRI